MSALLAARRLPRSILGKMAMPMISTVPQPPPPAPTRAMSSHSLTNLRRWSCIDKALPGVDKINHLHVYDFDNTLFCSPLPNREIWDGSSIGFLQGQDNFVNGGWWHDPKILEITGEGIEKEEPRGWEGWWNEDVLNLVKLTMQQKDAVNILLTGRSEQAFSELITRMVKSKNLEFDMICLKPRVGPSNQTFSRTMEFKQGFLSDLMNTYHEADEIRIYEDRPHHVTGFQKFFASFNQNLLSTLSPAERRKPIKAEVIPVAELSTSLNSVAEIAEVQRMINAHNEAINSGALPPNSKSWEIKRNVMFTGYLISPKDRKRLLDAANISPSRLSNPDKRASANTIMIHWGTCPPHILERAGGMGAKVRWRVLGIGNFENKVWAARVEPIPPSHPYYCRDEVPHVLIAVKSGGRPIEANRIQNWQPLPQPIELDTTVGEKVFCRIVQERKDDTLVGSQRNQEEAGDRKSLKRPRTYEDDYPPLGAPPSQDNTQPANRSYTYRPDGQSRSYHTDDNRRPNASNTNGHRNSGSQRGGRGPTPRYDNRGSRTGERRGPPQGNRGSGNNASGRPRGRGGYGRSYRSLDDDPVPQGRRRRDVGYDGAGDEDDGLTY